jgi:transglutaminase-like putative cysteine protease
VLWHFDGHAWRTSSQLLRIPRESLHVNGAPTLYSVTLEPHNRNWLLMLDMPTIVPTNAYQSRDLQVLSRDPVRTRIRYEGSSNFNYTLSENLSDRERELALQIPDGENPKSIELSKQWAHQAKTADEIVQSALSMFRQQNFVYTLSPPRLGENPIDDFIFNTKRGFCEHYASSFVYLMRAAGVPARVVTGYQGGEVNPVGNYLIVRQSDAHAWAEVWIQGRGWVRVDPTAAVSPSRIESGIESALPPSDTMPLMARKDYPFLRKLYLNWDALNNGWNQWVIGYDQKRQMELLSRLAGSQLSWQDMAIALMVSVAFIGLVISYFLLRDKRIKMDPLQRLYLEFLRKLESAGLKRQANEGPQDFGQRAMQRLPAKADTIWQIIETYSNLRYGRNGSLEAMETFKNLVKAFRTS